MNQNREKSKEILNLFACYPSLQASPEKQIATMLAAYLGKLQTISLDELSAACKLISSRNEPFPPAAGQLFHECLEIRAKRRKADEDSVPRLSYLRPLDLMTDEERAASKARVAKMVDDFKRRLA